MRQSRKVAVGPWSRAATILRRADRIFQLNPPTPKECCRAAVADGSFASPRLKTPTFASPDRAAAASTFKSMAFRKRAMAIAVAMMRNDQKLLSILADAALRA